MKIFNKYILVGLVALASISCTDDFDKMNTNPNSPSADNPATEAVLASSMRKAFHEDRFEFWRGVVLHAERFAGHVDGGYKGGWWAPGDSYNYHEGWTAAAWDSYNSSSFVNGYGGALFANTNVLLNYYEQNPEAPYAKEFTGICHVLRSFQFLKITDLFGDTPYSEHGNIDIPTPKFDAQKAIYDDIEAKLKMVVEENFADDVTIGTMSKYDLVYKGNVSKWRKFANSLRLRMALRRSNVDSEGAKAILADIVKYPLLEGNGDNVMVERTKSSTDLHNQYYGFFKTWPGAMPNGSYSWDGFVMEWGPGPGAFIPAREIVEVMKGSALYAAEVKDGGSASEDINAVSGIYDPRLDKYFMRPKGDGEAEHKGRPARAEFFLKEGVITNIQNDDDEGDVHNYSWMHPSIWYDGGTWNPVSLDYAEVCLALAEAVNRGLVTYGKSDADLLKEGLEASCERWGAEVGSFADDVVSKFNSGDADEKEAIIATERWVSAYTVPHQAYSVLRRTGHPEFAYIDKDRKITGTWVNPDGSTENRTIEKYAQGSTNFQLPQRMRVPESEVAINDNVPAENKDMMNKVWWANY
ncbi:SusD/RagB family nutrient-binding outer membrane lipoprotein [Carboxylicivirga sediminis]|uniref:SusD/RagB family nutrient-binding outer membrane lipoprotein n=1 Tax=Carboxylicivirga sediminis TaxID=2006564 RepID=A0A941F0Z0_9BACT|nr:SusD/RagB family nutrient-binding outer membrane lipoprotein [Carboxylicivirga sediminis]MBR8534873.1 SusD/RagB family nutrient-binding outer membrane lipoprotein [Carboxylicivirga sediminis]